MLANAQAHACEYLPVFSVETALVTQLHKTQTQYEAASEAKQALNTELFKTEGWDYVNKQHDDESLQQKWDESIAAEASAEAAIGAAWSEVTSAVEQSMRQALADYEEKHGMDHPTTARMAWRLGLQLKGEDKEAMLMRAARALLECPGPAHEMTWTCFYSLQLFSHLGTSALRKQLLHTMAAGLLAGTSYSVTNVNWEELGYDRMDFQEFVSNMLGDSWGYNMIMTDDAEVLMDMIQGAERFLGADHVLCQCLLWKLHTMLEQLMMELKIMGPDLQAQGVSIKDGASSIPAQGNERGSADEKAEGDAKAADAASDAGSQGEVEALTASAKYDMACKAANFGGDVAARHVKHARKFLWDAPPQDVFQKHLNLLGKPHAH